LCSAGSLMALGHSPAGAGLLEAIGWFERKPCRLRPSGGCFTEEFDCSAQRQLARQRSPSVRARAECSKAGKPSFAGAVGYIWEPAARAIAARLRKPNMTPNCCQSLGPVAGIGSKPRPQLFGRRGAKTVGLGGLAGQNGPRRGGQRRRARPGARPLRGCPTDVADYDQVTESGRVGSRGTPSAPIDVLDQRGPSASVFRPVFPRSRRGVQSGFHEGQAYLGYVLRATPRGPRPD